MSDRIFTAVGLILAILAGVFHLAALMPNLIPMLTIIAVIFIGLGSLTGK